MSHGVFGSNCAVSCVIHHVHDGGGRVDWVGEWRGSDVAALFKAPSWVFSTHIRSVGRLSLRVSSCLYGVRTVGGGECGGGGCQTSKQVLFCFHQGHGSVPLQRCPKIVIIMTVPVRRSLCHILCGA